MFNELEKKLKRFEELQGMISDQEVISNRERYQKCAKELAQLTGIVDSYKEYLSVENEVTEASRELKEDHDEEFLQLVREELAAAEIKRGRLKKALEDGLLEDDPEAGKDTIIEIRAGTGGAEASLFAADLFRMYTKYSIIKGWKIESISSSLSEKSGFKEVIFSVKGNGVYGNLKYESGTHRVQRVPETEGSGRIHTSAATVAVMPEAEDIEIEIKPDDLKIDVFRSGGAGGQHVNVTDSAVRITHIPTGLVVSCQDERSQYKNKAKGMRVLKARLYDKLKSDQHAKMAQDRKKQVGSGDRSEKIRTYNYPDRRVTDHRIGFTLHRLPEIMEGDMDELIAALKAEERRLKLGGK